MLRKELKAPSRGQRVVVVIGRGKEELEARDGIL